MIAATTPLGAAAMMNAQRGLSKIINDRIVHAVAN